MSKKKATPPVVGYPANRIENASRETLEQFALDVLSLLYVETAADGSKKVDPDMEVSGADFISGVLASAAMSKLKPRQVDVKLPVTGLLNTPPDSIEQLTPGRMRDALRAIRRQLFFDEESKRWRGDKPLAGSDADLCAEILRDAGISPQS